MTEITYEILNEIFEVDFEEGKLYWKERDPKWFNPSPPGTKYYKTKEDMAVKWNSRHAGKEAFTAQDQLGYHVGAVFNKSYKAHRIIWWLYSKEKPYLSIDHIDGDPSNNKISNLRHVSQHINMRNMKIHRENGTAI